MENNDNKDVIKDILYEESTLKVLQQTSVSKGDRAIYKWLAAAIMIGLIVTIGFNFLNDSAQERAAIAYKSYDFPVVSKSRGADINIVDKHIVNLANGNYMEVLSLLDKDNLSEKDKFVKAVLLFRTQKYREARILITETKWKDSYHQSELNWVLYLMAYIEQEPLEKYEKNLSTVYRSKALLLTDQ